MLILKTHMKKNSIGSSVIPKTIKGPWHWQVWEALGLCSAVTLPGQSYLISGIHAETSPPQLTPSVLSLPLPGTQHHGWLPRIFIVHLHSTGHACSKAGLCLLCTEVSLVFRALWNTDTQKALISNLWNGQIREQIKEENNEVIDI